MKDHFVVDGRKRLLQSHGQQERLRELRREIETRHAGALASADWLARWKVKRHIAREFHLQRRAIEPSARACYLAK